jgi:hypothetical protein
MQFQFLALHKFGKYKTTNKTIVNHVSLELWMYHTPLTWYEQESLGHKAHFEALPRALVFCVCSRCKLDQKTVRVGLTGRYTRLQNP